MFSRGIRAIKINDNISAVALKPDGISPVERARQLLSSADDPLWISCTPSGEILIAAELEKAPAPSDARIEELSKLTVYGVCMNNAAKRLEHTLRDAGVHIYGISLCDIAAAFLIDTKDSDLAVSKIRSNFTIEV